MPARNTMTAIGHLGRDPEVRFTQGGTAICTLSIGCTSKWQDKAGEAKEATEWVRCVVWGDLGELVGKEFKKGAAIHIEGRMETRKWQDKDGADKYATEVVANYVARPVYAKKAAANPEREAKSEMHRGFDDADSEIPF
jgi:single-strand DNA-binding protein